MTLRQIGEKLRFTHKEMRGFLSGPSEPKPDDYKPDHPTAEAMQEYIRLSPDAALAEQKRLHRNPKTVLRLMKANGLLSEIRRHRQWKQLGQQLHRYENLLDPYRKAQQQMSHRSLLYPYRPRCFVLRNLYDNSIVAYKTAVWQTVNPVLDTSRQAVRKEKKKVAAGLHLHSDQGFQYTFQAHFNLIEECGIMPSMLGRRSPYDNAMAENCFGVLKTECIYRQKEPIP